MRFVAIEGPDRVGKATQAKILERALNRRKIRTMALEVPWDDGVTYDLIYDMLRTGEAHEYPEIFQTLHATNRRALQAKYIPNLKAHVDVIVLDRWTTSTRVYGEVAGLSPAFIRTVTAGLLEPELTFVLEGPAFTAGEDTYETDLDFQQRVREVYRAFVDRTDTCISIDAHRPKERVGHEILTQTLYRLGFEKP